MSFLIAKFAVKKAVFDLNGNNRPVMSRNPTDMRPGIEPVRQG